jgi:predicted ferric reductase
MDDGGSTFWYLTRASGFVAYLLLFAALSLGLLMTGDVLGKRLARFRIYDIHRFVSLLALCLTLLHVFIVLPDAFIGFTLPELLVPFASPYEPVFMALGAFSFYLTAAVIGSFYALRRIGYPAWRMLHYATLAAFLLAFLHGVGAGSDSDGAWAPYLYAATGLAAFNLLVYRLLKGSARGGPQAAQRRRALARGEPPAPP